MDLRDRIIVITGAAGGIGSACVRRFAEESPRLVVACDLSVEAVERLAEDVNTSMGRPVVVGMACDVSDERSISSVIDSVETSHGPVDIYFANAGVSVLSEPMSGDALWERQWKVNTMAHVWAARRLLPGWIARGDGYLVTTASMAGVLTSLGDCAYSTTKHAAVGFAEWVAITYRDKGVKVSCVCPGGINTPMLAGFTGDAEKSSVIIGGGTVMEPREVADIVVAGLAEEATLIYTHPEMRRFVEQKSSDHGRWVNGMARQWQRVRHLVGHS